MVFAQVAYMNSAGWFGGLIDVSPASASYRVGSSASAFEEPLTWEGAGPGIACVLSGVILESVGEGWQVREPLMLDVELDDDGTWIATDARLVVYGEGPTMETAVDDFALALTEYYEIYERRADDEMDRAALRALQRYLRRK